MCFFNTDVSVFFFFFSWPDNKLFFQLLMEYVSEPLAERQEQSVFLPNVLDENDDHFSAAQGTDTCEI